MALGSAGFLSMLAHDSLPITFVLYTTYRYHWDQRDVGLVLGVVGVVSMSCRVGSWDAWSPPLASGGR